MASLKVKILATLIIGSFFLAIVGVDIGNWVVCLIAVTTLVTTGLYIEWDKHHSFRQIFRHPLDNISEPFIDLWRRITGHR